MKGWHFCADDRRLGYGDNREIVAGETIKVDCEPILCESGLHASAKPLDALRYARGDCVSYVELRGVVVLGEDKAVGTERHTYWIADAEQTLRAFACWCALSVGHLWGMPEIVRQYLETQDSELRAAARAAAQAASRAAARDAAWSAAQAAARAATWAAAWSAAARDAAWDAAWAASRSASRAAAQAASRDAARDAAWAAAWDAAWDATLESQNKKLEELLIELPEAKRNPADGE